MKYLLYIMLAFALFGCSQANTTGTSREYVVKIKNTGYLVMYTSLGVDAKTDQKQDVNNDPSTSTDANASLAGKGATASLAAGAAKQLIEGLENVSKDLLDQRDQSKREQTTVNEAEKKTDTKTDAKPDKKEAKESDDNTSNDPGAPEGFKLSSVKWLHTDVSKWPVTGKLRSVAVSGNKITLDYDKARVWPGVGEKSINANPWIFVKHDGKWYAATWEWLRFGQRTKALYAVSGSHIKCDPLRDFKPRPGELYGFMVSGLARDMAHFTNVQERTNIYWMRWPK